MTVTVRRAKPEDRPLLVPLFVEMDEHYLGSAAEDAATLDLRLARWFEDNINSILLIAIEGSRAIGCAAITPLFPAGSAQTALFVKELYVSDAARGSGVGTALLRACAMEADAIGASRLDLTSEANNPRARAFYERLGAFDTGKTYLRWEPDDIKRLAQSGG